MRKNLLPDKYNKGYIYEFIVIMITANILVGVVLAGYYAYHYFENKEIKTEIGTAQQKTEAENQETANTKQQLKSDKFYDEWMDRKTKKDAGKLQVEKDYSYNLFVYEVNKIIPDNIKLSNLTYINEGEILISGQSTDFQFVSEFYQNLINNKVITKGELEKVEVIPSVENGNLAIKDVVYFEIKGGKELEKP